MRTLLRVETLFFHQGRARLGRVTLQLLNSIIYSSRLLFFSIFFVDWSIIINQGIEDCFLLLINKSSFPFNKKFWTERIKFPQVDSFWNSKTWVLKRRKTVPPTDLNRDCKFVFLPVDLRVVEEPAILLELRKMMLPQSRKVQRRLGSYQSINREVWTQKYLSQQQMKYSFIIKDLHFISFTII